MSDERDGHETEKPATFEITIKLDLAGLPAAARRWGASASAHARHLLRLNVVRSLLIIAAAGIVTFVVALPIGILKRPSLAIEYAAIYAAFAMAIVSVIALLVACKIIMPDDPPDPEELAQLRHEEGLARLRYSERLVQPMFGLVKQPAIPPDARIRDHPPHS